MHSRMIGGQSVSQTSIANADIRSTFLLTTDPALVGDGTNFPIGFTHVGYLDRIFFQAKKLKFDGTLPGMSLTEFFAPLFGYPLDGDRAHLFATSWGYDYDKVGSVDMDSYNLQTAVNRSGRLFDNKFYPAMELTYAGQVGDVVGAYNIVQDDALYPEEAGTITLLGVSAKLYKSPDSPDGDIEITVEEEWVF